MRCRAADHHEWKGLEDDGNEGDRHGPENRGTGIQEEGGTSSIYVYSYLAHIQGEAIA